MWNQLIWSEQSIRGQAAAPRAQFKMAVSMPGDPFEQEADRIADRVVSGGSIGPAPTTRAGESIHRECAACAAGQPCTDCDGAKTQTSIQREASAAPATAAPAPQRPPMNPDAAVSAAAGGGSPLPANLRADFEPRFGHSFAHVRVHTAGDAAAGAKAVQARAYTIGSDIVFASGQYAPGTSEGRRLIAHELTHVIQQSGGDGTISRAPAFIMRDACEDECKKNFEESKAEQNRRIADMQYCLHACDAKKERPPPPKSEDPPEKTPAKCKEGDTPVECPPPTGTPTQPAAVSQAIKDRWMGKLVAKDGDPGEGCREQPYVAAAGEKVCTIGYGSQIPGCRVLSKTTNEPPTQEERFPPPLTPEQKKQGMKQPSPILNMYCECAATERIDCKGPAAEKQLDGKARAGVTHVKQQVPVDLDQAKLDALVDITLHAGHLPAELAVAIKKYYCSDAGWDKVRELYLKTYLSKEGEKKPDDAFIKRRQYRVWPPACGK